MKKTKSAESATYNSDGRKPIDNDNDPTAVDRKSDHIELAFKSRTDKIDGRFMYEPMLAGHPKGITAIPETKLLGKAFRVPLWVSSMTGGTQKARNINTNLARACNEFGMGMGLGSCRQLLTSDARFDDFNMRPYLCDAPLYANLGLAQIENLIRQNKTDLILRLIQKLKADGLIIHINPLQEWLQPEGDRFEFSPIDTVQNILNLKEFPVIVKEVGQGFGYKSMRILMQLPLAAIEFAAAGGTNFAQLELLRSDAIQQELYSGFAHVGHTADEMVEFVNRALIEIEDDVKCSNFIISGGISNYLDGYYCLKKIKANAIYGQASAFLKYAQGDYATLQKYIIAQLEGLAMAYSFLSLKN